jgi:hypothetical protein
MTKEETLGIFSQVYAKNYLNLERLRRLSMINFGIT